MPPEIQNKNTIATANAKNPFMNMSREELLAFKEQNPQFFQEQEGAGGATRGRMAQGGGALETLRGVGDIWSGGKSFTFDPSTGKPYAVETGVAKPAGGGINELIAIEKFKLQKQLQEESAEERKLKREKTAFELEEKKEAKEKKREERERRLKLAGRGDVTPDKISEIPSAIPSEEITPLQAGVPQTVAPQAGEFEEIITGFDETGTPTTKIQRTQAATARGKATEQALSQEQKFGAKLQRELKTSHTKMNIMFDAFLDTVARTKELTGVPPGPLQAPLTAILGAAKINQFQEAFKGAEPEYAAAIGRMAVPGARSVRLIDLFKKGAPSAWSTIPSGINNSAKSARMTFAGYLSTKEGSDAIEESYGVRYNPLDPTEWNEKANQILTDFEERYIEGLYEMVYMKDPNLLDEDIRNRLDQEFQAELQRRNQ